MLRQALPGGGASWVGAVLSQPCVTTCCRPKGLVHVHALPGSVSRASGAGVWGLCAQLQLRQGEGLRPDTRRECGRARVGARGSPASSFHSSPRCPAEAVRVPRVRCGVWQSDPAVRLIAGFLEGPVGSSEPSRVAGAVAAWPEPVGAWPRQEGVLASRPAWRTEQRRSHRLGISCTCSSDPASLSPRSNP